MVVRGTSLALVGLLAACSGSDDRDDEPNPHGILLTDVSQQVLGAPVVGGPSAEGFGSGAAIGDLDGDGRLDLVLVRTDAPAQILANQGGLEFAPAGELGTGAHGVALGDYDGDGDLDAFLAADGPDALFENDGAGAFTDVTAAAGVAGPALDASMGALWADLNGDGRLDLYVMNNRFEAGTPADAANRLYLNDGGGEFRDVSAASGTAGIGATWTAAATDLDGDGAVDLYLANDQFLGAEWDGYYLFDHFDGDVPVFVDHALDVGASGVRNTMGIAIADASGDGRDDIYLTNWGRNALLVAAGDGSYDNLATELGVQNGPIAEIGGGATFIGWGARFLDLDRDGALELFVVNGAVNTPTQLEEDQQQRDIFLRQPAPGAVFSDESSEVGLPGIPLGTGDPLTGRGAVVGDLDGDGDDDIVITPFDEAFRVLRNDTPAGFSSVRVRPVGPGSAGAVLEVVRTDGTTGRATYYAGGDVHSWSDGVLAVGLADAELASATLLWPGGAAQRIDTMSGFALDQTIDVPSP